MPASEKLVMLAVLTTLMPGFDTAGIVTVDVALTGGPVGGCPVAVPTLVMLPRSTSACVVV